MRRCSKKLRETLFFITLDSNKSIETRASMLLDRVKRHQINKDPVLERIELRFGILPCEYVYLKELLKIAQAEYKCPHNRFLLLENDTKNILQKRVHNDFNCHPKKLLLVAAKNNRTP